MVATVAGVGIVVDVIRIIVVGSRCCFRRCRSAGRGLAAAAATFLCGAWVALRVCVAVNAGLCIAAVDVNAVLRCCCCAAAVAGVLQCGVAFNALLVCRGGCGVAYCLAVRTAMPVQLGNTT